MVNKKTNKNPARVTQNPAGQSKRRWLTLTVTIVFIIVLGSGIMIGYFSFKYKDTVIPGIKLANRPLNNLTCEEVKEMINTYRQQIDVDGFIFSFNQKLSSINPTILSTTDPDLSYNLFTIDADKTAELIFQYGHRGNFYKNIIDYTQALTTGFKIIPSYTLDQNEILKILQDNFSEYESPASNPRVTINDQNVITILPEQSGEVLNYKAGLTQLVNMVENLDAQIIDLEKIPDTPTVSLSETGQAKNQLQDIINSHLPWILAVDDFRWAVGITELANWFAFTRDTNDIIKLDFNESEVAKYLNSLPGKNLNIEPKEGKFKIENNRVTEFQVSEAGSKINLLATLNQMRTDLLDHPGSETRIILDILEPHTTSEDVNTLGIKELVAVGQTNFRGSPKNRVHNIGVGAETLNGLLIKPGEEFSLVQAIGEVDASTGYLPELVIKGNRTIPEYGGGLCQIGTTTFRLALNAGLPIIERQNHSYRVSYYEPPVGMDATIYNPKPDLRFINNYDKYLLIQTRIEGTELIFEFYGTKDKRKVTLSDPVVSNYVKPGPTKYVETEDLAPGEIKCTEKAHTGADAEFTYTVEYPDGKVESKIFESHYKAWPEVCLIGQEQETEDIQETETEENIED